MDRRLTNHFLFGIILLQVLTGLFLFFRVLSLQENIEHLQGMIYSLSSNLDAVENNLKLAIKHSR